jgi:hypothetical protein
MNSGSDAPPQSKQEDKRSVASNTIPDGKPMPPASAVSPKSPDIAQAPRIGRGQSRGSQEFRPSLKPKRPEDRVDPLKVDPTLRLDLLAKVQGIKLEGASRSLFDFSQAPPPKTPDVKVLPKDAKPDPAAVASTAAAKPAEPVKPPPPPIPLKFYGFINPAKQGIKRAFFIDGEEIFVATEGEIIKKRYKVVRIGINSAVVEDMQSQHQQTIPLEEQPA